MLFTVIHNINLTIYIASTAYDNDKRYPETQTAFEYTEEYAHEYGM